MSDFGARLVARARGIGPFVAPRAPPRFAARPDDRQTGFSALEIEVPAPPPVGTRHVNTISDPVLPPRPEAQHQPGEPAAPGPARVRAPVAPPEPPRIEDATFPVPAMSRAARAAQPADAPEGIGFLEQRPVPARIETHVAPPGPRGVPAPPPRPQLRDSPPEAEPSNAAALIHRAEAPAVAPEMVLPFAPDPPPQRATSGPPRQTEGGIGAAEPAPAHARPEPSAPAPVVIEIGSVEFRAAPLPVPAPAAPARPAGPSLTLDAYLAARRAAR